MWKPDFKMRKWQASRFSELANLPKDVRDQLLEDCARQSRFVYMAFGYVAISLLVMAGAGYYFRVYNPPSTSLGKTFEIVFIAVFCVVVFVSGPRLHSRARKRWLNEELVRRRLRPKLCLCCGYDLRGTPDASTSCPECGAAIAALVSGASEGGSVPQPPALPGGSGGDTGVNEQQTPGGAGG
jgi:hypothetical protein